MQHITMPSVSEYPTAWARSPHANDAMPMATSLPRRYSPLAAPQREGGLSRTATAWFTGSESPRLIP